MNDRRRTLRRDIDLLFNRYIDGRPYLCRAIDLSSEGALAQTFVEPDKALGSFAVEIRPPGAVQSIWAWARGLRRSDGHLAMQFVSMHAEDRRRLHQYVGVAA